MNFETWFELLRTKCIIIDSQSPTYTQGTQRDPLLTPYSIIFLFSTFELKNANQITTIGRNVTLKLLGSGCGSVGSADATDSRGPRF